MQKKHFVGSMHTSSNAWLVALLSIWAAACLTVWPIGDFPINDDWVYALSVKSILDTGRFELPSPAAANVFAQAYWGAAFCKVFGFSFTVLRLSTIVLGAIGIVSMFRLLREVGASSQAAFIASLTMAANPLYLGLANSFMTDVPFTALGTFSLWMFVCGILRRDRAYTYVAIAVALMTVFIRQFALVLLAGYAIVHVARNGFKLRVLILAVVPLIIGVGSQFAFEQWLIATHRAPELHAPLSSLNLHESFASLRFTLHHSFLAFPYIGMFTAPFLIYAVDWRRAMSKMRAEPRWTVLAGFAALTTIGIYAALNEFLPALGNVMTATGMGPLTLRDIYVLNINQPNVSAIVWAVWATVTAISLGLSLYVAACVAKVGLEIVRKWEFKVDGMPNVKLLMITVGSGYLAGLLLLSYTAVTMFDRYLLFLLPVSIVILQLEHERHIHVKLSRVRLVFCWAALAASMVFATTATHDYLAWNAARWKATDLLHAAGVNPNQIDGGYEYNGWLMYDHSYQPSSSKSWWWVQGDEFLIAAGPVSGYAEVERVSVGGWLPTTLRNVVVLRRAGGAH